MQTEPALQPAFPQAGRQKIRLGDLLVEQKVISSADLDIALATQKKSGRRLGRIIVESGLAGENDIAQALARQLNLPFIDLRAATESSLHRPQEIQPGRVHSATAA